MYSRMKDLTEDKYKEYHKIKHNVYCKDYIKYDPAAVDEIDRFKNVSIKEILTIWGYEEFYDEMINRCVKRLGCKSYLNTVIAYDHGDLDKNFDHQKLLSFDIFNERTGSFEIVGGILFVDREMSFHT